MFPRSRTLLFLLPILQPLSRKEAFWPLTKKCTALRLIDSEGVIRLSASYR